MKHHETSPLLTPAAFARRCGVSRQRVMVWIAEGRIAGARKVLLPTGQEIWLIPATARRPAPLRPRRK